MAFFFEFSWITYPQTSLDPKPVFSMRFALFNKLKIRLHNGIYCFQGNGFSHLDEVKNGLRIPSEGTINMDISQ